MQAIKLSQNDEYHLKQRNKIETLLSLLRRFDSLFTNKAHSLMRYLVGIYPSLYAYQIYHQNKKTIQMNNSFTYMYISCF